MKGKASKERAVNGTIKEILLTILGVPLFYVIALGVIGIAIEWNTVAGGVMAVVVYGFGLYEGVKDLRSREAIEYSVWKVVRIFLMLLLVAAAVFGTISLILATVGWAKYEPEGASFYEFTMYYIQTSVDVLPGLELSETLGLKLPVEPEGAVAGLPVVVFRVLVIFGIVASLTMWWSARSRKKENGERPETHTTIGG